MLINPVKLLSFEMFSINAERKCSPRREKINPKDTKQKCITRSLRRCYEIRLDDYRRRQYSSLGVHPGRLGIDFLLIALVFSSCFCALAVHYLSLKVNACRRALVYYSTRINCRRTPLSSSDSASSAFRTSTIGGYKHREWRLCHETPP